jgi:hypothetical protein
MAAAMGENPGMHTIREQPVTNAAGEQVGVFLDLASWRELLAELEELDDLRTFDEAVKGGGETIPLDQAVAEIERGCQ